MRRRRAQAKSLEGLLLSSPAQIVIDGDRLRLVLSGAIDVSVAEEIAALADPVVAARTGDVVVDLSGVTFIDSSGVGALVALNNSLTERGLPALHIAPGPPNVMRVLHLVGLDEVFQLGA
jgi:anti-anti-sigma factor